MTETALSWSRPNLFEYWDQREDAIAQFAAALRDADENTAQAQFAWLAQRIGDMARAAPTDLLVTTAWVMADDLYKAASSTLLWDNALEQYLTATARVLTGVVSERGLTLSYVVDNTFGSDNNRPLTIFGPWFNSAGFVYVCPQSAVLELAKTTGQPTEIGEARDISNQVVSRCLQDHRHYVYLDADFQIESVEFLVNHPRAIPGVIAVFRNEPPVTDTNVQVHLPDIK